MQAKEVYEGTGGGVKLAPISQVPGNLGSPIWRLIGPSPLSTRQCYGMKIVYVKPTRCVTQKSDEHLCSFKIC